MSSDCQSAGEHPRLDALLENWRVYQLGGGTNRLGVKTQSHWASGSSDFDSMVAECDMKDAIVMDAVIWDLPTLERSAVMHVWLQAVFRFQREPLEAVYARARLTMSAGLTRRGVV